MEGGDAGGCGGGGGGGGGWSGWWGGGWGGTVGEGVGAGGQGRGTGRKTTVRNRAVQKLKVRQFRHKKEVKTKGTCILVLTKSGTAMRPNTEDRSETGKQERRKPGESPQQVQKTELIKKETKVAIPS